MHIFITGAAGFIGQQVVRACLSAGHTVTGLTRGGSGPALLTSLGATPLEGTLSDLSLLTNAAAAADAVVHLAFVHDFANYAGACATDRAAISALGEGLSQQGGKERVLVITSGTMMCDQGRVVTEADPVTTKSPMAADRGKSEGIAFSFGDKGVRVCVLRLPPCVHGRGGAGFVSPLAALAKQKGRAAYLGAGTNRYSAVHHVDAAALYLLVAEKGKGGSVYHAVAEEALLVKEVVGAMGKSLGVEVVSLEAGSAEATEYFGMMIMFAGADGPASAVVTKEELGWEPVQPTLLEDLESGVAFLEKE